MKIMLSKYLFIGSLEEFRNKPQKNQIKTVGVIMGQKNSKKCVLLQNFKKKLYEQNVLEI